jgi:hypothetical protein
MIEQMLIVPDDKQDRVRVAFKYSKHKGISKKYDKTIGAFWSSSLSWRMGLTTITFIAYFNW